VKYVCNTFHALKISFANEMGMIAQSFGIDSHQVMDLVCRDTKLNISARYLSPGFAFGGSCLPKDVRALLYKAREMDVETPVTRAIMETNRSQVDRAINMILGFKKRKISMLGITFKAGTDDLRESPLVTVTEALIGKGQDVRIYDNNISLARLTGANKKYIEGEIPHISSLLLDDLQKAVAHGEVLVIGNRAPEFSRLKELPLQGKTIVDLARVPGLGRQQGLDYHGITW
jgi:GDP-mannose 6-dehydrogenase